MEPAPAVDARVRVLSVRHYVGEDRRARPASTPASTVFLLTTLGLLAVLAATSASSARLPDTLDAEGVTVVLSATAAVLGAVVAVFGFVRSRLTGDARALWLGTAAAALGPLVMGAGTLGPGMLQRPGGSLVALKTAGEMTGIAAFAAAALWPPVDTRLRPRPVAIGAVLATVGFGAVLAVVPGIAARNEAWIALGLLALWLSATTLQGARAWSRRSTTQGVVALAGGAFVLSHLLGAAAVSQGDGAWSATGAALLRAFGLALLLSHALRDLESAFAHQRARLFATEVSMETEQARRRAELAEHEERAHDAKNALLAIEGATLTLERHRDRLNPDERAQLTHALAQEVARLQRLVEVSPGAETTQGFPVLELVGPIGVTERARGAVVHVDVPPDLRALGRPAELAEVIRNLLDNARHYAPGSPVTIRGVRDGAWAVLYVEDRGAGVPLRERERIFERGYRGNQGTGESGSGLGLFVSRRLMVEQGGDLWVESRQGGGASFGACLPLARAHHPLECSPEAYVVGEHR